MSALNRAYLFPLLLGMLTSVAHSVVPPESLVDKAHSEIHQTGQNSLKSTSVEVGQAMLTLKDPKPEIRGRNWDYSLQLGVQDFHPRGIVSNDLTPSQFDLSQSGGVILPSFEFGIQSSLLQQAKWKAKWGLGGYFAYTSQKAIARFDTGFEEPNVRLNSMLWSAIPNISLSMTRLPRVQLNLGYEWGVISYTQVSANKNASLSSKGRFAGLNAGLEYSLSPTWSLMTQYSQRQLTNANTKIQIQPDNYKLGARILW